ncbi:MAG: helix-turn-helix domain-containing protein [Desulfovibrio sp.]|nr:helix-turn-helix domain-containing protein [Desulfovibrio sp.]
MSTELQRAFGERLRRRRRELDLKKQELADRVGVSLTTIQQYENGHMPRGEHAVRLSGALACTLDWLLAGREGRAPQADDADADFMMVPMVEARLSAGTGSFETGGEVLRHYAFRREFLRRKGAPAQMALMRVSGDSMSPRIEHNDVVLIDASQRDPVPGRIYAVGVEDMVYLKIVNAVPGKLRLTSFNKDYAPIEAQTGGQLAQLVRILGRTVWVGRELE